MKSISPFYDSLENGPMEEHRKDGPPQPTLVIPAATDNVIATGGTPLPDDPFDPSRLRLSQNFGAKVGVKKLLNTIRICRPANQWFVRTHPDPTYRIETCVVELKLEHETYLVDPTLWSLLPGDTIPKLLVTAITRQDVLFLWPIRLPGPDGRLDDWNRSAFECAERARTQWMRLVANQAMGAYDLYQSTDTLAEPEWPDLPFSEILRIAFRDKYIREMSHPVLKGLRGEL